MQIEIPYGDLLKGQLHNPGWYKGEIVVAAPKPTKDKQSMNYEYVVKYSTGSNIPGMEEREIKSLFNSKAMGFANPFFAALANMSMKEFIDYHVQNKQNVKFEWDQLIGKKLQIKIENKPREDNGQLASKITDFAPYDYKIPF